MKLHLSYLLCLICIFKSASAQNTTNLPTSMYGIGELSMGDGGPYAGIGNMGIALNRMGFNNTLNPAAITSMDTLCFTFDVGAGISSSYYSYGGKKSGSSTGNLNRLNMGCRIMKNWYGMVGVTPYSSIGYLIRDDMEVEGTNGDIISSYFEGSGGLFKVYISNSFLIGKHFSVGFNIGLITGTSTQYETQESANISYEAQKRGFYADIGLYYEFPTQSSTKWAIGAIYAPSIRMSHDNQMVYTNSSTSEELEAKYYRKKQYLPQHIGGGISMTSSRLTVSAEYNWIDWSRNNSSAKTGTYENQHKANLGLIYVTKPNARRSLELMAGGGYSNSYISVKGGKMKYFEANAGVRIPILYSYLSLSGFYRKQTNTRNNLMQESRYGGSVSITFGERISRFKLK